MTSMNDVTNMRRMRIERRGGAGGLQISVERECASLTPDQQHALIVLLTSAPEASEVGNEISAPNLIDQFRYRVLIIFHNGQRRTLDVPEHSMPAELEALATPGTY